MSSKKIVFIHGMFVTNVCWTEWTKFFTAKGYECFAPAWPYKDKSPDELRRKHPDLEGEGRVCLKHVVSVFEDFIKKLDGNPILIGHSMGGLITQILMNKNIGSCGVVIDSAPPKNVFTAKLSFVKANWPVINPFINKYEPTFWSKEHFQYAFADHLSGSELDRAYQFLVPQSKLVPRDSLTNAAKIDFINKKAPLLFIAGEKDKIIPASLNKTNYRKYLRSKSVTDFKEFPDRRHDLINDRGWEEIAEYILTWLQRWE